jgi:hypothetical protein
VRTYSTEQQHHALRIASSRELNETEASALIRGVEAYRDAETEIAQLRADLAADRIVREADRDALAAERAAHAETRKALETRTLQRDDAFDSQREAHASLESTRAELAKSEARVKELRDMLRYAHSGEATHEEVEGFLND